jgi:hypothetical protein
LKGVVYYNIVVAERIELTFVVDVDVVLGFVLERGFLLREMGAAQYKGGRHWHVSKQGERGVLELTWAPSVGQMWLEMRENRRGAWVVGLADELVERYG